jgi:hypothetical protein
VLTLDREFDSFSMLKVLIDGKTYPYMLNYIKTWVVVKMGESIKNNEVELLA